MANKSKTKEEGLARTQANVYQKSETNVNKTQNVDMKIETRNTKTSTNRNKTKVTKETVNTKSTHNEINRIEQDKTNKNIIEPIIGQAIFNGTIVNYLCDGGADVTIINEKLLEKLTGKNQTAIIPYKGNQINSCSGKITIFGTVNVEECIIDPNLKLPEVQLIATNQNSKHECILGRDLMDQIPSLKVQINEMKKIVKNMSEAVKERYKVMKSQQKLTFDELKNANEDSELLELQVLF